MTTIWIEPSDAFWAGFIDGYNGTLDRPVPLFHRDYELGFIFGWAARNRNTQL